MAAGVVLKPLRPSRYTHAAGVVAAGADHDVAVAVEVTD
jgi:hypothetical protein